MAGSLAEAASVRPSGIVVCRERRIYGDHVLRQHQDRLWQRSNCSAAVFAYFAPEL